jgi:hypothetical protein
MYIVIFVPEPKRFLHQFAFASELPRRSDLCGNSPANPADDRRLALNATSRNVSSCPVMLVTVALGPVGLADHPSHHSAMARYMRLASRYASCVKKSPLKPIPFRPPTALIQPSTLY